MYHDRGPNAVISDLREQLAEVQALLDWWLSHAVILRSDTQGGYRGWACGRLQRNVGRASPTRIGAARSVRCEWEGG